MLFPDAVDHHGGYLGTIDGLIEDIELRHRTIDSSMHFITNVIIDLEPSEQEAEVESYCLCYLRQEPEIGSSTHVLTTVKCRYVDRSGKTGQRVADSRSSSRVRRVPLHHCRKRARPVLDHLPPFPSRPGIHTWGPKQRVTSCERQDPLGIYYGGDVIVQLR